MGIMYQKGFDAGYRKAQGEIGVANVATIKKYSDRIASLEARLAKEKEAREKAEAVIKKLSGWLERGWIERIGQTTLMSVVMEKIINIRSLIDGYYKESPK